MLNKLLKALGFADTEEAVEFVITGLAILPPMFMMSGFIIEGAIVLLVLILLLAAIGVCAPPPDIHADKDHHHDH